MKSSNIEVRIPIFQPMRIWCSNMRGWDICRITNCSMFISSMLINIKTRNLLHLWLHNRVWLYTMWPYEVWAYILIMGPVHLRLLINITLLLEGWSRCSWWVVRNTKIAIQALQPRGSWKIPQVRWKPITLFLVFNIRLLLSICYIKQWRQGIILALLQAHVACLG